MLAYLDCFSGISGDMLLGAVIDAGADADELRAGLAALPIEGYTLEVKRTSQHGLSGTAARVAPDAGAPLPERHLADVEAIIRAGQLPERVRERALAVFQRLAEAEARVHGVTVQAVHFHEVGAVDAIVDIVGTMLGFELLGVESIYCSELPLTAGRVRSAHGDLPVPAPAVVELLRGTGAQWRPLEAVGELVTPTGAAVVAALAQFERPAMSAGAVGYGFGQKELAWANCLRLMLGAPFSYSRELQAERDMITVMETHIDNMTGEALGWLMDRLLAAGALDVAYAPLQMKKNRPATRLTVIAAPERADALAHLMLSESATLGVRMGEMRRLKAGREQVRIATPLGEARVKLKLLGARIVSVAAEYDDARELAERHGLPLEDVIARVEARARALYGLEPTQLYARGEPDNPPGSAV
jgi:uncharacterized protein (TIGR00299 family) protein